MNPYNENILSHLADVLSLPICARCIQLKLFFERCDIRELTEVFPIVVKSIFGSDTNNVGWGLRTTTKENATQSFVAIHDFLDPLGPMFHACYRLIIDPVKFEFALDMLPRKMVAMMQNGTSTLFYGDLVNIDPLQRRVASLSLNAFDYFVLHFTRHATIPLHRQSPVALQVHNELLKSVYFFLSATYLNTFLPGNSDTLILPTNIPSKLKTPQPSLPVQQLQPKRKPKYLKIPSSLLYSPGNGSTPLANNTRLLSQMECSTEIPSVNLWRTESVLNFFLDTWLRIDIEEARDLPSTDFIRVARILVKQVHCFGNFTYMDNTSMASIRKSSQTMMRHRIYPFLKSLISRWPLDDSLAVVLELWFSYIQPWRYSLEVYNNSLPGTDVPIHSRYDNFINDNLPIYTQIFIDVMSRFGRLDFTSMSNVNMLHRLAKVFNQPTLPQKLYQAEITQSENSFCNESPQRQSSIMRNHSGSLLFNSSSFVEWETAVYSESTYTPLFSSEKNKEINNFIRTVHVSRLFAMDEIQKLKVEIDQIRETYSPFKKLVVILVKEELPLERQLKQLLKIPYLLENSIMAFISIFGLEDPFVSDVHLEYVLNRNENFSFTKLKKAGSFSSTCLLSKTTENMESFMKSIDPALIPIQEHECKLLVKMLHNLSQKINFEFNQRFNNLWNRADLIGKISRQFLLPPMKKQWFDKSKGVTELFSEDLPARICLRPLASYRTIGLVAMALILGNYICGSPLLGLFYFLATFFLFLFVMSIFN